MIVNGDAPIGADGLANSDSRDAIPAKDRFQFLFTQTADLAKALPSYQFQFSAALVIVLGWLLTSDNAKAFIAANPTPSRAGAFVLVICLVVLHSVWLTRHVRTARRLHRELSTFAESVFVESKALVKSVSIDPFLPWSYAVVNLLICGAILVVCWMLAG